MARKSFYDTSGQNAFAHLTSHLQQRTNPPTEDATVASLFSVSDDDDDLIDASAVFEHLPYLIFPITKR